MAQNLCSALFYVSTPIRWFITMNVDTWDAQFKFVVHPAPSQQFLALLASLASSYFSQFPQLGSRRCALLLREEMNHVCLLLIGNHLFPPVNFDRSEYDDLF